ncbi:MAG: hypothetical protein ACTSVY_06955 [Candidatus Helarchaeota archaeon]
MVEELKKKFKELKNSIDEIFSQKTNDEDPGTAIIKRQEPFFEKLTKFSENMTIGFESLQEKFINDFNKFKQSFQDFQEKFNERLKELEENQKQKKDEFKKNFEAWKEENKKNLQETLNLWSKNGWKVYVQLLIGTIPVIIILAIIVNIVSMIAR